MRKVINYLFVAMAALALASCAKETENELLNPKGTPVKFAISAEKTSETAATIKVTADVAVPANVTVALAAASTNNMVGMTFPTELVIEKGTTEATANLTVDTDALTPEVAYKAVIEGSVGGTAFGSVTALTIKLAKPAPVICDGDPAEWANLPSDYVTELKCNDASEYKALKSAKVFYEDKLYVLLEVSDEALAKGVEDGKLRVHFYFDSDNSKDNGYCHKWAKPAIDLMLEGKLTSAGEWCAISSKYQKWTGTDPTVWSGSWTADANSPAFEFAGKGNYYECAMDYSNYPGGLGKVIGMGFDTQDGDYNINGLLPSAGKLATVVKNGEAIPEEPVEVVIDGDFSEWKATPSIAGDGAIRVMKMQQTAEKIYFYVEVNKADENIKTDATLPYAHKLMLCFDDGKNQGGFGDQTWGGARYAKMYGVWMLQNGVPNLITWDLIDFEQASVDGEVMKFEFGFNKPDDAVFKGNCLLYSAYLNDQYVEGEVWNGAEGNHIGNAPAADQPMPYVGEAPSPVLPAITIDGDMIDWNSVTCGLYQADGVVVSFKATYDENNIYVYTHRTWHSGLWGSGYFYYEFDTDNNATTGLVGDKAINGGYYGYGIEKWMYLQLYGGSADAPSFNTEPTGGAYPDDAVLANVKANGVTDGSTSIETETLIPRANLGVKKGDIIRIYSVGNKSGSNFANKPLTLRLDK